MESKIWRGVEGPLVAVFVCVSLSLYLYLSFCKNKIWRGVDGPLVAVRLEEGKGPHTEDPRSASGGHRTVVC